jgi:hypothetical protein
MADNKIWTLATATTPLAMVFVLLPTAIHVTVPEPEEHVSVLPAAVSAGPAAKVSGPRIFVG